MHVCFGVLKMHIWRLTLVWSTIQWSFSCDAELNQFKPKSSVLSSSDSVVDSSENDRSIFICYWLTGCNGCVCFVLLHFSREVAQKYIRLWYKMKNIIHVIPNEANFYEFKSTGRGGWNIKILFPSIIIKTFASMTEVTAHGNNWISYFDTSRDVLVNND